MKITSQATGITYNTEDTVAIFNPVQYGKYISHGAIVYDIGVDNGRCYLVFDKEEVAPLFDAWCNHTL